MDGRSTSGDGTAGSGTPADPQPPVRVASDQNDDVRRDDTPTRRDVFLSYAREDVDRAEWAFRVLTARGWTVWFDREMPAGERWRKEIDETLDDVGCVVVLWSSASIESHFVMDEAGEGMERGVLVPALLEDVEIPIGFRQAHAIDLVEPRVPLEEAEAALVAGVANALGRPAIEPPKPSRFGRLFRREAPLAAAILPLVIGLPFLLRPAPSIGIDMDVIATELSFASTREQDLTDMTVVSSFAADGLESIRLPRTRTTDERLIDATTGAVLALRLAGGVAASTTGSITVESIRVSEGTRVVLAVPDSQSARISLSGAASPVAMSVEGTLLTGLGAGDTEVRDYGVPKPLSVLLDPHDADLVLRGIAAPRLVSAPVAIEELSLARIDETLETAQTALTVVSTIRSGTVRIVGGGERPLGAGERLRLGGSAGEIRELTLAGNALSVRFAGATRSIESCSLDDRCVSWMPSTLESLVARRLPWVLGVGVVYAIMLLFLTRRRFGRAVRLATIAAVLVAAAPTGTSAQAVVSVLDPEESVKRLIVRVESATGFGSGIIVGARSDTLFIATANHVVRRGATAADTVDVRFYWNPDSAVAATLLPTADDSLDLAVMALSPFSVVPGPFADSVRAGEAPPATDPGRNAPGPAFDARALPFDRLADLDVLERGDPIWLLGQPNGLPWRINMSPERFIGFRGESLDFESNLLARGHSGGALLNGSREIVGMLKSDQAPYGEAVSIYAVARKLEEWGWPVDLRLRPPQLRAGQGRTCVLTSRGDTRCIGFDDRYEPGPIQPGTRFDRLSMRDSHACGIAAGGRAFCIGPNANGQLGDGTTISRYDSPAEVAGGLAFESISAGSGHTCGIVSGGDVYCWGLAEAGQLGTSFVDDWTTPIRVPTTQRFRALSAMWQYTCGLDTDGEAWCWGSVAGSLGWRGSPPARFAPDLSFASLTAGWYQVCAITTAGKAWCWGFNDNGQLGTGSTDDDFHEVPLPVSGDHSFTDISSGVGHVCGLTVAGQIWCWGSNHSGQLGNGTTDGSAVPVRVNGAHVFQAVSAGDLHTCGLTRENEVWCWGNNGIVASHEGGGVLPGGEERYTEPVRTMTLDSAERTPWRR